jgi:hypothetical protein
MGGASVINQSAFDVPGWALGVHGARLFQLGNYWEFRLGMRLDTMFASKKGDPRDVHRPGTYYSDGYPDYEKFRLENRDRYTNVWLLAEPAIRVYPWKGLFIGHSLTGGALWTRVSSDQCDSQTYTNYSVGMAFETGWRASRQRGIELAAVFGANLPVPVAPCRSRSDLDLEGNQFKTVIYKAEPDHMLFFRFMLTGTVGYAW